MGTSYNTAEDDSLQHNLSASFAVIRSRHGGNEIETKTAQATTSFNTARHGARQKNIAVSMALIENHHHQRPKDENDLKTALLRMEPLLGAKSPTARGDVTPGTCQWIHQATEFKRWDAGSAPLLWIRGGPGKGKTFLSRYLVEKLRDMTGHAFVLQYFCDNRDNRRNTAHAVLTSLIYQLLYPGDLDQASSNEVKDDSRLKKDILQKFEIWGMGLFSHKHLEDLWWLFERTIREVQGQFQSRICLVLDGLDECDKSSSLFLTENFKRLCLAREPAENQHLRTIIISRDLERDDDNTVVINLDHYTQETGRDLTLFIQHRVANLRVDKEHKEPLKHILLERANGTFLWLALAMDMLHEHPEVAKCILESKTFVDGFLPRGLPAMYRRILLNIREPMREDSAKVIHLVSTAFRPLTMAEIRAMTGVESFTLKYDCRHILSLTENKTGDAEDDMRLQLVHQSFKEYLMQPSLLLPPAIGLMLKPYLLCPVQCLLRRIPFLYMDYIVFATIVLQARDLLLRYLALAFFTITLCLMSLWAYEGPPLICSLFEALELSLQLCIFYLHEKKAHNDWFMKCLELMNQGNAMALRKDICGQSFGTLASDIPNKTVEEYLPLAVQYSCHFWAKHLERSETPLYDDGPVYSFLCDHLLHWLEALSWIKQSSEGTRAIELLESMVPANKSPRLHALVHDAKRFILYNQQMIEEAPLQTYRSALMFAPQKSLVRQQFMDQESPQIQVLPAVLPWGAFLQTLEGHSESVEAIAFSPNGKLMASGSGDCTIRIWHATTNESSQVLQGHSGCVRSVAFSPNSKLLVSSSDDSTIVIWDVEMGISIRVLKGHIDSVRSVAFSPNGELVASASFDFTARIWNVSTGTHIQTYEACSSFHSIVFSPDGNCVALASGDDAVRLWDFSARTADNTTEIVENYFISALAFSFDGALVALAADDGIVMLLDTVGNAPRRELRGHSATATSVAFSSDSKLLASGSFDHTVILWDTTRDLAMHIFKGHSGVILDVAFSPDSSFVASASHDGSIKLWDGSACTPEQVQGHTNPVSAMALSPDGRLLASVSSDETIMLWDPETGLAIQTLDTHPGTATDILFSPDGDLLASRAFVDDNTVTLWDITGNAPRQTLQGHSGFIQSMAFSIDSKLLASGSGDGLIILWAITNKKATPKWRLSGHTESVRDLSFSHDTKRVISASFDHLIMIWDSGTGQCIQTLKGHSQEVHAVSISPKSNFLASASNDLTVKLWCLETGSVVHSFQGHSGSVLAAALSPNGKLIASASVDKTVRIWDIAARKATEIFQTKTVVKKLCFSLDGSYLETDRGRLELQGFGPDLPAHELGWLNHTFVNDKWITRQMNGFIWLPQEYRAACVVQSKDTLVLGCNSGYIIFLKFKKLN